MPFTVAESKTKPISHGWTRINADKIIKKLWFWCYPCSSVANNSYA
jgi:hypothetical protein